MKVKYANMCEKSVSTSTKVTMEGFTEKVVNPMKSLDLYESRGSPIMLSKLFRIGPSHLCQANSRFGICSGEVRRKWRFIRQPPHGIQHSRFIIEQEIKINEAQKHWASFCCDATKI
ncbi:unnamed protein product [Cuscuta europaea]|uniref:Uncharacterized protein n=1 Tax=Cuscuta europaea TaxID=41803 RepID=A0A9P1A1E7_CUSEU|nr:unnamed protein product [Cuscuta europaea]